MNRIEKAINGMQALSDWIKPNEMCITLQGLNIEELTYISELEYPTTLVKAEMYYGCISTPYGTIIFEGRYK